MRFRLISALVLIAVMMAGCSSGRPGRPRTQAPAGMPTVRMLAGTTELPGILGSYCWLPGGTGKCVDTAAAPDLVKGEPYTDLSAHLTTPIDRIALDFGLPTKEAVLTLWYPDPLYDPAPGAPQMRWISQRITADSSGHLPLPTGRGHSIYEVAVWWEGGGNAVFAFPVNMPSGHLDFATLHLNHISSAYLGETLLHPGTAEGTRMLEPLIAAVRTATFQRDFAKIKTVPDVMLKVNPAMGDTMHFGYIKGHGVTVWTEKWELWTDSPALVEMMKGLAQ